MSWTAAAQQLMACRCGCVTGGVGSEIGCVGGSQSLPGGPKNAHGPGCPGGATMAPSEMAWRLEACPRHSVCTLAISAGASCMLRARAVSFRRMRHHAMIWAPEQTVVSRRCGNCMASATTLQRGNTIQSSSSFTASHTNSTILALAVSTGVFCGCGAGLSCAGCHVKSMATGLSASPVIVCCGRP